MIRYLLNKSLVSMQARYDYDVKYMQSALKTSLPAFLKFLGFQSMASHRHGLPASVLYAARIRTIIFNDCGPCTQLFVNMALEEKVPAGLVSAVVSLNYDELPDEVALAIRFTEFVLAHNPEADPLREQIVQHWGDKGLLTLSYAISTTGVYPALKYALGHGHACSRVQVAETQLVPNREVLHAPN